MTPAEYNLVIYAGAQFGPLVLTFEDSLGVAMDLTGYGSPIAKVFTKAGGTEILDLSPSITDAAAGEVTITVDDSSTTGLAIGEYVWDLYLVDGSANKLGPYLTGQAVVKTPISF
jgi:hypothetical protein